MIALFFIQFNQKAGNIMKPKIKEIVTPVIRHGSLIRIGFEGKVFDLSDENGALEELLHSLNGKNTIEDLESLHNISRKDIETILSQLDGINMLEDKSLSESLLNNAEKSRYRANLTYFENYSSLSKSSYDLQHRLKNTHVLVLGLGGAIQDVASLASLGIGEITGLDYDLIEESNLNRQYIYKEEDVGQSKAQTARKRIKEINRNTRINIIEKKVQNEQDVEELLEAADIVVSGIDSPGIISSRWVNFAGIKQGKPVIFSGISGNKLMINKLSSDGEGCFDCFLIDCLKKDPFFKHQLNKLYGANFEKKNTAISPTVSLLSGFITLEVMKEALGLDNKMIPGSMYQMDLNDLTLSNDYSWEKAAGCPTCSSEGTGSMSGIDTLFKVSEAVYG
jgi:molybdopterin-synthase adenylyltransferase